MTATEARLREALRDAASPVVGAVDFDALAERHRRRRYGRWLGAGTAAAAIGAVILWAAAGSFPSAGDARLVPAAPPSASRQVAGPAVRDASVDCDGYPITAQTLAQPGNAENGTTAAAADLRQFLTHNPFEGMGTVPNTHWLTLVDTANELAFGHREGAVGVGPVISLHLKNGRVIGQNLGGCSTVLVEKGRSTQPFWAPAARGRQISLQWANGLCNGVLDRRFVRAEVHESAGAVHIMIVTESNRPDSGSAAVGCAGVGTMSTNVISLKAPLGRRTLYDDSTLTPTRVMLSKGRG